MASPSNPSSKSVLTNHCLHFLPFACSEKLQWIWSHWVFLQRGVNVFFTSVKLGKGSFPWACLACFCPCGQTSFSCSVVTNIMWNAHICVVAPSFYLQSVSWGDCCNVILSKLISVLTFQTVKLMKPAYARGRLAKNSSIQQAKTCCAYGCSTLMFNVT